MWEKVSIAEMAVLSQEWASFEDATAILDHPFVQMADRLLDLFKTANASTLVHHEGHRWLHQFLADAEHEKTTGALKAQATAVLKYVGASRPNELTQNQYSTFVRRFDQYLLENTAPSRELAL